MTKRVSVKRTTLDEKVVSLLVCKNALSGVSEAELLRTKSGAIYIEDVAVSKKLYLEMEKTLRNASDCKYSNLHNNPQFTPRQLEELDLIASGEANMTPEKVYYKSKGNWTELVVVGAAWTGHRTEGCRNILYASLPRSPS